ncbi:Eco57I restriction-modification methylase domain-containing protein [Xanthomarina sp. F2636L]|uniref:Eco57I restriction-modification methylase domain-containing protein n=1 Tax=Xanthomarina sp. F2636L TaxID=2996018 RepID=UPI00225E3510|nr:N-6 DNA methylase [Xanthomarina sp. F2636L]MCX7551543.1 N-6 DNA methylase [Xanthomarina sp. F2636L]
MPIFQNTVVTKYLQTQNIKSITTKWELFQAYFHNLEIQDNIRNSKEEQFQEGFLRELFVKVLGYTLNPEPNFNLTTELKNVKDSKKADGAIIINDDVKAVIELKGMNTTDLGKIETQAFGYKNNQSKCTYVITSNFEKIRFYIDNAIEHIEFNLFTLTEKDFELLYLCLAFENISKDIPSKVKKDSLSEEDVITKSLYKDYSVFKRELYQNLVSLNPQFDSLTLFKQSQTLLDRFLFLFFAEDRHLLPPNSVRLVLSQWKKLQDLDAYTPLFDRFKKYFGYLNTGFKGKNYDVYAYNGGLFKPNEVLDNIVIDDDLLYKHTLKLSDYDFDSEVDVNILGHIFENSLNEIDEVKAELEGQAVDKSKSKRKKDGVFYTPKYITKYIVENTVGKLCEDKKAELEIVEADYITDKKRQKKTIKGLMDKLTTYRDWLLQLTICDPACGSGAFLNQALDFLIAEHGYIDELQAKLFGDAMVLSDVEKSILENNLFGVDLNEESVEIAKLSLWLRTAQPNRKLNDLSNNIKCGNSLIDDHEIAGDKAFNWKKEFPNIFAKGGFDVIIGNPPYVQIQSMGEIANDLKKQNFKTFERTGDLYCLFYELGNIILRNNGLLGFITSNKWMKANYGKSLRNYFIDNTQPIEIIDLGSGIFESATVDSNLFIFKKDLNTLRNSFKAMDLTKEKSFLDFTIYEDKKVIISFKHDDVWTVSSPLELQIKQKIESFGKPLKDWDIKINYGIKTGLNEAFIISEEVKNKLIKEDAKNSEIIKPILRGRDVHRYCIDYANLYLINSHNGYKNVPRIKIEDYPSIKSHLEQFEPQLSNRGDKGDTPYNLRSCAYLDEFNNEKVYYNEIGNSIEFFSTNDIIYCNNKLFFLTSINTSLKFLTSFFNSRLYQFYFSLIFNFGGGKGRELFSKIPIPKISLSNQKPFIEKADQMLTLNKDLQEVSSKFQRTLQRKFEGLEKLPKKLENWYELTYADFIKELKKKKIVLSLGEEAEWEDYFIAEQQKAVALKTQINQTDKEIDQMVYELYGLTEDEIKIVENS